MDRLDKLEKIVNRITRRVRSTTASIITPHIISGYVTDYGEILNSMLFSGKITKALICFDRRPKNTICIEVSILNKNIGFSKSYYVDRMREAVDLDLPTIDGSIISVSVNPTAVEEDKDKMKKAWLSILWQPSISSANVKSYLIDSLDEAAKEFLIEE